MLQHLVFLRDERLEVYQNCNWIACNLPATDTHTNTLLVEALAPVRKKSSISLELRVITLLHQIRTDNHIVVSQKFANGQRLGRNYRMDTANFVTYLPTNLKQVVRHLIRITHKSYLN